MLQKLYEKVDSKVLTAEVKDELEREFAAAVDTRVNVIAEAKVDEIEHALHEKFEQRLKELDDSSTEYQNQLKESYDEKVKQLEQDFNNRKIELNEKNEKDLAEKLVKINKQIDIYAKSVAEIVVKESKAKLQQTNEDKKARAMYSALSCFAKMAGYNLGLQMDEASKQQNDKFNKKYTEMLNEKHLLEQQLKLTNNKLLFEQLTNDMSMFERERMRLSVDGVLGTIDPEELKTTVAKLKETYRQNETTLKFEPRPDAQQQESISHLLLKNII